MERGSLVGVDARGIARPYRPDELPDTVALVRANQGITDPPQEFYFRWQYEENPAGRAHVFRIGLSFPGVLLRKFAYRVYQKYMQRDFSPIALLLLAGAALFLYRSDPISLDRRNARMRPSEEVRDEGHRRPVRPW